MAIVLGAAVWLLSGMIAWILLRKLFRVVRGWFGMPDKIWTKDTRSIGLSLKSGSSADEINDAIGVISVRAQAEDPEVSSIVRVRAEDPWILITYTWEDYHAGDTGTMSAISAADDDDLVAFADLRENDSDTARQPAYSSRGTAPSPTSIASRPARGTPRPSQRSR